MRHSTSRRKGRLINKTVYQRVFRTTTINAKHQGEAELIVIRQRVGNRQRGMLFVNFKADKKDKYHDNVTSRFGNLKTALGFAKNKHTFHSFRATALTALLNAEVFEPHARLLSGHTLQGLTYGSSGYTGANPLTPEVAAAAIAKIQYPFPASRGGG